MKTRKSRKSWSERVKTLIKREGGSMEALAGKLGVSFFTVLRWKNGECKPSPIMRREIEKMEEVSA